MTDSAERVQNMSHRSDHLNFHFYRPRKQDVFPEPKSLDFGNNFWKYSRCFSKPWHNTAKRVCPRAPPPLGNVLRRGKRAGNKRGKRMRGTMMAARRGAERGVGAAELYFIATHNSDIPLKLIKISLIRSSIPRGHKQHNYPTIL